MHPSLLTVGYLIQSCSWPKAARWCCATSFAYNHENGAANQAKRKIKTLKIHLDTDFGGDIDDICALAMLLRWPGEVQLTGVTTVGEVNGRRAGQVKYVLELEGRSDVPVAAPTRIVTRIDGDKFSEFWAETLAGVAQTVDVLTDDG